MLKDSEQRRTRFTALLVLTLSPAPFSLVERSLGTTYPVPEWVAPNAIKVDGCPNPPGGFPCPADWANLVRPPLSFFAAPLTGSLLVVHPRLIFDPILGVDTRHDSLYMHLVVNDNSNDANDDVVFMLDVDIDHLGNDPDDRGVRFTRNGTVELVKGNPDTPTSIGTTGINTSICNDTQRVCIKATAGASTTQWVIEAKLSLQDFGLKGFAGPIAGILVTHNASLITTSRWPSLAIAADPNTWAELAFSKPVDVMLVLDLSGSMQSPACGTCQPKIQVLKDAARIFVELFQTVAVPADRLGVRYFSTNVTTYPLDGSLPAVQGNALGVITDVTDPAHIANGMTAMGGGLQAAINALTNPTQKSSIILFTDGMQNVNPMVNTTTLKIENDGAIMLNSGVSCSPTLNIVSCPTQLGVTPSPTINTVGVGAALGFIGLLSQIANATGGKFKVTTIPDDALRQFFVEELIDALRGHSPQLIAYRHGSLTRDTATETFTTDSSARKIILELSWDRGDTLTFWVERDGVNISGAGEVISGPFYQIFDLYLPAHVEGKDIRPGGDWRMHIRGPSGARYEASAIADEPLLKYDFSLGRGDYVVGDTIVWNARISFGGQPLTDARVTATVLRPIQGIGTLLSLNPTPPTVAGFQPEPSASAAQNKLQLLLQDDRFWRRIQPIGTTVILRSQGDGSYSAAFPATEIEGSYTASFQIEGVRPDVGTYRRTENLSTTVRFGRAEFGASGVRISPIDQTAAGRHLLLYIRPKDRFGNYLGPDYGDRITVSVSPGSVSPDRKDLVDGGYTIPLSVPPGTNPLVAISVMGQPLFRGRLSELEVPRFAFSLHGGVSFPHSDFKNAFDQGFGITVDLEHQLSGTFTIAALFGFHRFDSVATSAHLDIYHISGSLEAYFSRGAVAPFIEVGGGSYTFHPGSTKPGAHAGAGVELQLSPHVSLGASYRLHMVFTGGSNTTFSTIQGGGRVRF